MENSIEKTLEESALRDCKKVWERRFNFSKAELIDIFGRDEVVRICTEKMTELLPEYDAHKRLFKGKMRYLKLRKFNEVEEYIIQGFLELGHKDRAIEIKNQIKYLASLYLKAQNKSPVFKNSLTDEEIERAREYPTHELYEGGKYKTSHAFIALCIFHKEKTPSLFIYEDWHFHCYACGAHGNNAIDYLMKFKNLTFKEAVQNLI